MFREADLKYIKIKNGKWKILENYNNPYVLLIYILYHYGNSVISDLS